MAGSGPGPLGARGELFWDECAPRSLKNTVHDRPSERAKTRAPGTVEAWFETIYPKLLNTKDSSGGMREKREDKEKKCVPPSPTGEGERTGRS